jgi:hypothetical protein
MNFQPVGLTGFEPATSWSRTERHNSEPPKKQGNSPSLPTGYTTGYTTTTTPLSPLAAALLALLNQLPPDERARLAAALSDGRVQLAADASGDPDEGRPETGFLNAE